MDKRQEYTSQAANKTETYISVELSDTSDTDSNQESEIYLKAYKPESDILSTELRDASDPDYTADIELTIASCREMLAAHKTVKKSRQDFVAHIVAEKAMLSECTEVDYSQEFETFDGSYRDRLDASHTDKRTEDVIELEKDIHSSDIDETSDADTSQEYEACIDACKEFASCVTEARRVKNDERDILSKIDALREVNDRLEKNNEILKKSIKKTKEEISRMAEEKTNLQRYNDLLLDTQRPDIELDEVIESINRLLPKKKK